MRLNVVLKILPIVVLISQSPLTHANNCQTVFISGDHKTLSTQARSILEDVVVEHGHSMMPEFYAEPLVAFRGFTSRSFGVREVFRLFEGDRRHEIRSWDYKRLLESNRKKYSSYEDAISATDLKIAQQIKGEVESKSVLKYLSAQVGGTVAGKPESAKRGSALPAATGVGGLTTAEMYANIQLNIAKTSHPNAVPFVVEIREPQGTGFPIKGLGGKEYYLLSHISLRQIHGFFVGVTESGYLKKWIYLEIRERDEYGRVTSFDLHLVDAYASGTPGRDTLIGTVRSGEAVSVPQVLQHLTSTSHSAKILVEELKAWN